MRKKIRISLLTLLLIATGFCHAEIRTVTVLQTTDLHGSPDMAKVVALIRQQRKIDPHLLLIDCGDLTQGSYENSFDHGSAMVDAMQFAGYDVFVPGNHDFDYGTDVLKQHLKRLATVRVLGANLSLDGTPLEGWTLFERNGVRIAVIGIVPPYLYDWTAAPQLTGVTVRSVEQGIARVMPAIRRSGADLVILAIHLGEFSTGRLNVDGKIFSIASVLKKYPEISLVLAGHTHQCVSGKYVYPGAWLVQTAAHAKAVAEIRIQVDTERRKVVGISSLLLTVSDLSPADDMPESWHRNQAEADSGRNRIVAELPEKCSLTPLKNLRRPGTFAPLCARAMAECAGVDVAFSSSYSTWRVCGSISEYDLYRLIPFENYLTILTLTREQLEMILQEQACLKGSACRAGLVMYRRNPETKSTVTAAFSSYAVSGAGGRFPVLKRIAGSGTVNRRDLNLTVRQCFRTFLMQTDLTKSDFRAKVNVP